MGLFGFWVPSYGYYIVLIDDDLIDINKQWMLAEIDEWNYKGKYNKRNFEFNKSSWIRAHGIYSTLEYRIGEMTFDYKLIVKRIIHCQSITERFNTAISYGKELQELQRKIIKEHVCDVDIEQLINSRVIKL